MVRKSKSSKQTKVATMKIAELMTPHPVTCARSTNLCEAAALMLQADCGILPLVEEGKICGVVTDRDLFIALGTRNARPASITVGDVARGPVYSCGPEDDIEGALELMREHAIRRLPVEEFGGTVVGIVSLNDLLRATTAINGLSGPDIIATLQAVASHRHSRELSSASQ
jgi:CBS domain-containing protein